MKNDMQLHQDIVAELTFDPRVREKEIGVAVKDGEVTLSGPVPTFADKWSAERAAERVEGVKAVANELAVAVPSGLVRSDTEIAHAVETALAWDVEVPDEDIKASVSDGWITLRGEVTWQYQRGAAERAVRNLAGVRGVSNAITGASPRDSTYDVTESIRSALRRRAEREASHVVVQAMGDVVTLRGTVPSFAERRAIAGAAWAAPGVKEVKDELTVTF